MSKVTKTIRVDESLWQEVKIHVAKHNKNISSFVDDALKEKLKKKK